MGNNITSLTQFYAPPNPPTPLSSEKYFWIKSTDIRHEQLVCDGAEQPSDVGNGASFPASSSGRDIPVVHITRETANGGNVNKEDGSEEANEDTPSAGHRNTILYCHGHDVDLGMIYDFLVHLSKLLDADILCFDYSGYGLSKLGKQQQDYNIDKVQDSDENSSAKDGRSDNDTVNSGRELPTEEECYTDILTCFNYLVRQKGVPPKNIILYGKSLGSGPVCWLAHKLCHEATSMEMDDNPNNGGLSKDGNAVKLRRVPTPGPRASFVRSKASRATPKTLHPRPSPLGGVILHSAFQSILRLQVGFPLGGTMHDAFDNVGKLQDMHRHDSSSQSSDGLGYTLPIYLMHGKDDKVIPFSHGEVLRGLIMERRKKSFPPFWADGGTHWNIEHKYATAYIKRLQQFIRQCNKVNNVTDGSGVNKSRNRGNAKSASRRSRNSNTLSREGSPIIAAHADFHSAEMPGSSRPANKAKPSNSHNGMQQQPRQANPNQASDGRGRSMHRPSNTSMTHHHRARSSSNARQRKKKGTLVMRGVYAEEEEDVSHDFKAPNSSITRGYNDMYSSLHGSNKGMGREGRNPPSQARF